MYEPIWTAYKKRLPNFPAQRRPRVGSVIKETRVDKGIRQMDFASEIGLNLSTLKSIENDHQHATTVENLQKCAERLSLPVDDLILRGRERDPANCFVFKREAPPEIKGVRRRKQTPEEWHESQRLQFQDFDFTPCSPPIATKRDFFFGRINLPPKRAMQMPGLGIHMPVSLHAMGGFNIKISYQEKKQPMTSNQALTLDGYWPYVIENDDDDQAAILYLITKLPSSLNATEMSKGHPKRCDKLDIARGIQHLRMHKSDRPNKPLPLLHLADLTDSLDHEQIAKLSRVKKGSPVIYWEKIEDLLAAANVSMDLFLKWCRDEETSYLSIATASTRPVIDYGAYHALRVRSAIPPNLSPFYFAGEIMMEGKQATLRKPWERQDQAMIAIFVEEGELEITVGKHRSALPLAKGESIYFDGSLGYVLRNPALKQARGFLATHPAIHF